jgi:L-threonylcarbamoyladenylate synthase
MLEPFADLLKNGGVVAFPTETVYGLGASAWNEAAIRQVFELKGRPSDNPLIVHVSCYPHVKQLALDISPEARLLMQKFWPGPLTLVFRKTSRVPGLVSAGLDTVAVRMPNHALALELIRQAGPLVGPSANKSGGPSPTNAAHVKADFGTSVPVVDGGPCDVGLESTVLDVSSTPFTILRPGVITAEIIREVCGISVEEGMKGDEKMKASPGTKYAHYAPKARVKWEEEFSGGRENLTGGREDGRSAYKISHNGNLENLATRLYAEFRKADEEGCEEIRIERIDPNHPLAKVLLNRIEKAMT